MWRQSWSRVQALPSLGPFPLEPAHPGLDDGLGRDRRLRGGGARVIFPPYFEFLSLSQSSGIDVNNIFPICRVENRLQGEAGKLGGKSE